jgi:hypothetical protein
MRHYTFAQRMRLAWSLLTQRYSPNLRDFLSDDNPIWTNANSRDKLPSIRQSDLANALLAWQSNPLARRIVNLTRDHVWGRGIRPLSKIKVVQHWLDRFWDHPLNLMDERIPIWIDALTTDGEVFPTFHTNPADGITYIRALSSSQVEDLTWQPNDYEQLTGIGQRSADSIDLIWWKTILTATPEQPAAWQYAVNRPLGVIRGDGDLTPALPWLASYSDWLDGRVKRNQVLTKFYYEVSVDGDPNQVADARTRYRTPPADGTVVVHSTAETHKVIQPDIGADDASADGYALRMMIATGGNIPLHWLSEPGQGNSEATSGNMNDVSYRFYQTRQSFVKRRIEHLCTYAYERAAAIGAIRRFDDPLIRASSSDISRDDNQKLAAAARDIAQAFSTMIGAGLDRDKNLVRLIYHFAGEDLDEQELAEIVARAEARTPVVTRPAGSSEPAVTNPQGDPQQ